MEARNSAGRIGETNKTEGQTTCLWICQCLSVGFSQVAAKHTIKLEPRYFKSIQKRTRNTWGKHNFSIQCGGVRPALSSHVFVDLMGSNTWACHGVWGVWWWIIRAWHVITCHYILPYTSVYRILPTYQYCSSYPIMGVHLSSPPHPRGPSWPWHRVGRIVGLQQPLDLPKACRLSDRPFAHAHAASQSLPSWHSPQPILIWNQAGTDWSLFCLFIHVHPLLDVHPFHGSNVCIIRISWIKGYYRYGDFMGWNLKSLGQVTKTQPLWMIRRLSAAPGNGLRAHWRDLTAEPAHRPPRRAKTTPPVVRCGESTSVQRLFKSWPWKSSQVQSPWSILIQLSDHGEY